MTQLDVLRDLDASSIPMVQMYGAALRCEALRAEIFAGRRTPLLFGEPEPWIALLLQAAKLVADERFAESEALRDEAFERAPATPGVLNEQSFEWIADADTRLGPVLEAIVNGRYYWIPFHRIREVRFEPPTDLRDVVWMPAQFSWSNGGEAVGLVPTRYPGSEASDDGAIRLARRTDWLERAGGVCLGMGQRMLATDAGEYALMEVRKLRLDVPETPAADGASRSTD